MNCILQYSLVLQVFFSVIIGVFSLGQAIPHLEKFVSAAGASVTIYSIIDEVIIMKVGKGSAPRLMMGKVSSTVQVTLY